MTLMVDVFPELHTAKDVLKKCLKAPVSEALRNTTC